MPSTFAFGLGKPRRSEFGVLKWLEITPDYRCNNRCLGCYSARDDGPAMTGPEVLRAMYDARRQGASSLWLGGGEPTLRRDLFAIVKAAREIGFDRVKLQTNGMLLSYPDFLKRCIDAGVTEVNFAIKGACAETHDRLTQTPGCFELLLRAIEAVRKHGLPMEGDVLVYKSSMNELPDVVRLFSERGLERFNLWLLSASLAPELTAEVPKLSEVVPFILRAMDATNVPVTSLHTPPCTIPATHHACLFQPAELGLLVVNPGGESFLLEESPMEGGSFLERCGQCSWRPRCSGIRAEYLALHGDLEFQPQ
ncbi:MAG TPA: radical SAM protein [Polyangiaceae bacterium]|nr:radical SAM protein [Polyangiaceae bacterium]